LTDHLWERLELATAEVLPADQLLHVLTCTECRDWLVGHLLDDEAGEETQEDLYAAAFTPIEDSEVVEAARKRRRDAEGLLGELLSLPLKARANLVTRKRFRSVDLLDLLVELSHSSQPANPAQAQGLAEMASRLAAVLGDEDPEAAALVPRAFCLDANALRLQHDLSGAEARLAKAAPFLACVDERAFYSRTAALVRWEEGRTEEAMALLGHALRLYQLEGPQEEAEVCVGLTGLLLFEENQIPEALPRLHRAWRKVERERRPPLALRIGMALAISLALARQPDRARQVRQEAWKLYSKVPDTREMLRIYGYEGRLLGLLGEFTEAEQVLGSVRRKLLEESSYGEAALASLDLAMVLAEARRVEDIVRLSEDLERSSPRIAPMDLAAGALMGLASHVRSGEILPWECAGASGVALRRSFRAVGLRLRPLPFA
jgi:tetratricopeptide (TPR) repeat protein